MSVKLSKQAKHGAGDKAPAKKSLIRFILYSMLGEQARLCLTGESGCPQLRDHAYIHTSWAVLLTAVVPLTVRAILISLFLRYPILHAPMFCHLPQGFQNCFCFCSTTFPFHVGTFFRLQLEFQWENDQNK